MNKELKYKIRELKKLKKGLKVGTQIRRDINKQIRELKKQYEQSLDNVEPEKRKLIDKIYEAKPHYRKIMDLRKFTTEQLKHHYETKIEKRN